MSKKKNSPALFELIAKTRDKQVAMSTRVPEWMAHREPAQPAPEAPPKREVPVAPRPPGASPESTWTTGPTTTNAMSLGYGTALAVGVVFLLLLGGAFWLGRATAGDGAEPALAGTDLSERTPVSPDVAQPANAEQPTAVSDPPRIKGKHYLIVQGLQGTSEKLKARAIAIAAFCNENGEPVTVGRYPGAKPQFVVWSLQGFDSTNSAEAINFARTIEKLGKLYMREHGGYDFRQRDSAGTFRPWWHTY